MGYHFKGTEGTNCPQAQQARGCKTAWLKVFCVCNIHRAASDVDKARLLAAASPHSGDLQLLATCTTDNCSWTELSDEAIRVAVAHRLGSTDCEPHTCVW